MKGKEGECPINRQAVKTCLRWETSGEGENSKVTDKVMDRILYSLFWDEGGDLRLVKGVGFYSEPIGIIFCLVFLFLFSLFKTQKRLLTVKPSMIIGQH